MTENAIRAENTLGPKTGEVRPLAEDILRGADKIAEFVFGDAKERRKIYHLVETSRLPVFRLGAVVCARKSVLMAWIEGQESRANEANS